MVAGLAQGCGACGVKKEKEHWTDGAPSLGKWICVPCDLAAVLAQSMVEATDKEREDFMSWAPAALRAARATADRSLAAATRKQYMSKATAWVLFCQKVKHDFVEPPPVRLLSLFGGRRQEVGKRVPQTVLGDISALGHLYEELGVRPNRSTTPTRRG